MAHIIANLPPVKCFVRREFLYDFEKGHGELEPCWWISIKSLRGQAFRIESYLNEYGALYDKLPLHAYCWKPIDGEPLPLDYLQLWDCFHENITAIEYDALFDCRAKVVFKDKTEAWGNYMMTFDWYRNSFSDEPSQYKCLHMIALDDGNYALQPNNRIFWKNMSFVTEPFPEKPDYLVDNITWRCEGESDKWIIDGNDNCYYYDIKENE